MAKLVYPLTRDHLQAFGGIIQQFARFERLVELTISAILNTKYGLAAVAVAGLGYSAKCDALNSLLVAVAMDQAHKDAIADYLKDFNSFNPLRNAIAHHVWKEGTKRETVKPLSVSAKGGKAKVKGFGVDEQKYTIDDLFKIGNTLIAIHDCFRDFLFANGFITGISEVIE